MISVSNSPDLSLINFNTVKTGLLLLMIISATSCTGQKRVQSGSYNLMLKTLLSNSVDQISVDSLEQVQDRVILLDARSPEEYEVSHMHNARFVGYENFDSMAVAELDRDAEIVVYCAVGYRSEKIGEKLEEMDFKNVLNLYGGIFEWKNRGHEVVNHESPTDTVHAYSKTWGMWLNKGEKVYE
jgi:rhodanese-related sulfurtransferase